MAQAVRRARQRQARELRSALFLVPRTLDYHFSTITLLRRILIATSALLGSIDPAVVSGHLHCGAGFGGHVRMDCSFSHGARPSAAHRAIVGTTTHCRSGASPVPITGTTGIRSE